MNWKGIYESADRVNNSLKVRGAAQIIIYLHISGTESDQKRTWSDLNEMKNNCKETKFTVLNQLKDQRGPKRRNVWQKVHLLAGNQAIKTVE